MPALALRPGRVLWGALDADGLGLVWTLWHGAWQLWHGGGLGLQSELIAHPHGGWLVPVDPLEVVLLAPLTLSVGPVMVFNLVQVTHVAAAAACTCWLARLLTGDRWASLAVAGSVALSPMLLATAHNGNIDAGQVYLLPLVGGLAWRAARGGRGRVALAGVALGLCAIANVYVGIGAGVVVLALFVARGPVAWGRLVSLLVLAASLALPVAWWFGTFLGHEESLVVKDALAVAHVRALEGAGTVRGLLGSGLVRARMPSGGEGAFLNGFGLCWIPLLLALPRGWRPDRLDRALWAVAAAGVLLTFGPVLRLASGLPGDGGELVPLPYALLGWLPPFDLLIELWRFSILTQLALALLAARTLVARPARIVAPVAGLLLVEALLLTPGWEPWRVESLPDEPVSRVLAGLEEGAVLHYPIHQGDWPLYYQTLHHRPVANTPMGKGEPALVSLVASSGWTMRELRTLALERDFRWMLVHTRQLPARPGRADELLADLEVAGLLLHHEGGLALVDLEALGPWPGRPYHHPEGGEGSLGPPPPRGIPGTRTTPGEP